MRVLVTRPEVSAGATAEKLRALGHEPILMPLTEAVHHDEAARAALAEHPGALAVTSAEALRALPDESIAACVERPIFCVGPATASAAEALGFQHARSGRGTGRDLAEIIIAAGGQQIPLLYLAGVPRSPDFETLLRQGGILFRTVEVYRMAPLDHAPETMARRLREERPETILLYSHETARRLFELVKPATFADLGKIRFLCMSAHVAKSVPDGLGDIAVASEPSEEALLALL